MAPHFNRPSRTIDNSFDKYTKTYDDDSMRDDADLSRQDVANKRTNDIWDFDSAKYEYQNEDVLKVSYLQSQSLLEL